jgi:hypothetical protein
LAHHQPLRENAASCSTLLLMSLIDAARNVRRAYGA